MAAYRFITRWYLEAPLDEVYEAIFNSLAWPEWWRGAEAATELAPGNVDGIGSIRRYTWKSRLPYRLVFDARTTQIERLSILAATVDGDLQGCGRWLFSRDGRTAVVRYEWYVDTTKRWMNLLAPVARYAFRKNHDWLMERGAEGLARKLNARLLAVMHEEAPHDADTDVEANMDTPHRLRDAPAYDR